MLEGLGFEGLELPIRPRPFLSPSHAPPRHDLASARLAHGDPVQRLPFPPLRQVQPVLPEMATAPSTCRAILAAADPCSRRDVRNIHLSLTVPVVKLDAAGTVLLVETVDAPRPHLGEAVLALSVVAVPKARVHSPADPHLLVQLALPRAHQPPHKPRARLGR